jgi:hypothetical protein
MGSFLNGWRCNECIKAQIVTAVHARTLPQYKRTKRQRYVNKMEILQNSIDVKKQRRTNSPAEQVLSEKIRIKNDCH